MTETNLNPTNPTTTTTTTTTTTATSKYPVPPTPYTAETLEAMDDRDFRRVVTDDLYVTGNWHGPFQHPSVIERTAAALAYRVSVTELRIAERNEDPDYPGERIQSAEKFLKHLESVLEIVDRRIDFLKSPIQQASSSTRMFSAWKDLCHELADIIEDSNLEGELDLVTMPFGDGMTLRAWLERRRAKDPTRAKDYPGAVAA